MSNERRIGDGDVEGDDVREEESEMEEHYQSEFSAENEEIDDAGGEIEIGEDGQIYAAENDNETASASDKRLKAASIDRLSALPDVLLIHILSRLRCVKKAAITSVLSKRWQYLWTDLPELEFRESSIEIEETRKLVARVHRALILRTEKYLDSLTIHFAYDKCFASNLNVWIEFVVKNKVKKLHLELHSSSDFHLIPQVLYSCSSLTMVSLQRCILSPQGMVNWKNLTNLSIDDVELPDHVIQKILSGCPVLHILSLSSCWGYRCLEVESQSIRELYIQELEDEDTGNLLEISAPYVESLGVTIFPIDRKNLRIKNAASLVRVFIHFDPDSSVEEMDLNCVMEILEDIRHVNELELGSHCNKVLSEMVTNGWRLPQSTRKSLIIDTKRDQESICGIVGLLESSPHLETLVVQCCHDYEDSRGILGPMAKGDLDCDLPHLKTIDLIDYADP